MTSVLVLEHWLKHWSTYPETLNGWIAAHTWVFILKDEGERSRLLRSVDQTISTGARSVEDEGIIGSREEDE